MISRHKHSGLLPFLSRTISAQTHLVSFIASIFGTIVLVERCSRHSQPNHIAATSIFGVTSAFLFGTSSLYHFLYDGFQISEQLELWFEKLDHVAILLFISGTYTAVLMNAVSVEWANRLLVVIWLFASLGILYTLFRHRLVGWAQHRYAYTAFYVSMGWIFIIRLGEIISTLSPGSVRYLLLGGFSYSVGAIVYALRWPNFANKVFGFHEIWHICVVLGFVFHYLLIFGFY